MNEAVTGAQPQTANSRAWKREKLPSLEDYLTETIAKNGGNSPLFTLTADSGQATTFSIYPEGIGGVEKFEVSGNSLKNVSEV